MSGHNRFPPPPGREGPNEASSFAWDRSGVCAAGGTFFSAPEASGAAIGAVSAAAGAPFVRARKESVSGGVQALSRQSCTLTVPWTAAALPVGRRLRAARLLFHRIEMPALFERRGHGQHVGPAIHPALDGRLDPHGAAQPGRNRGQGIDSSTHGRLVGRRRLCGGQGRAADRKDRHQTHSSEQCRHVHR